LLIFFLSLFEKAQFYNSILAVADLLPDGSLRCRCQAIFRYKYITDASSDYIAHFDSILQDLQKEKNLTFLFIAHDLSMVKHISDRIGVMYLGHLVELADSITLSNDPLHPYTEALLSAIPIPDPNIERSRQRIILEGDVASPINPPSGCPFRTRCSKVMDICSEERPKLVEYKPEHFVACHLY